MWNSLDFRRITFCCVQEVNWLEIDWTERRHGPNRYRALRITQEGFALPGIHRCGRWTDKSPQPSALTMSGRLVSS